MEPDDSDNNQAGQFDFILKPGGGGKLSNLPLGGLSNKVKFIALGGGAIFLLIIFFVVYGALFSKPENSLILGQVGKQQANILQAAEIGVEKARGQAARNLAITTQLSLLDDQKSLLAALGDKNVKVSTSDNEELEQKLIIAEQANRFDEELLNYLHTELGSYVRNLQSAFNTTEKTDKELRQVLAAQHKNAKYLAGENVADQN